MLISNFTSLGEPQVLTLYKIVVIIVIIDLPF